MNKLVIVLIIVAGLGSFTNSMAIDIPALTSQRDSYQKQLDEAKTEMIAYMIFHPGASASVLLTGGALSSFLQENMRENMDDETKAMMALIALMGVGYCLNSRQNAKECGKVTAELVSYKNSIDGYQSQINSLNAQLSPGSVGKGYSYHFTNKCKYPVRLAIHFVNLNNNWQTEGWWNIKAGGKTYLADSNNVRLKSNKSIWYFYAETTDGSKLSWTGDKRVSFRDRSLKMYKMEDSTGDSEWYTDCPNK